MKTIGKKFLKGFAFFVGFVIISMGLCTTLNAKEEVIILKLAHPMSIKNERHVVLAVPFKKEVEERTNGQIKVDIFPNEQLGNELESIESCRAGAIDITSITHMKLGGFYPQGAFADLPYIVPSAEKFEQLIRSPVWRKMSADLEKMNLKPLNWTQGGFRNVISMKPIKTVADIRNLKIRTTETPTYIQYWKSLGAIPVPIAWSETYTGLQTGVVNAVETVYSAILDGTLYERAKFLTETDHAFGVSEYLMNTNKFNSLKPEFQKIVLEAAERVAKYQRDIKIKYNEDARDKMVKEYGCTLNMIDKEPFIKAAKPIWDQFKYQDILKEVVEYVYKK